jgi:hypothetical protein
MLFYGFCSTLIFFLTMSRAAFFTRIKWIIALLLTIILDTLPVPILGFIILYILIFRPLWFRDAILEIYDIKSDINGD